ncbi:MAG: glycerophosphodiester phosphodiesterase [Promethearchaeota archaeon]
MTSDFLFIGHRGTRHNFDENTIEAFQIALESGANYIEFDIRQLKDGNIVVFHDSSLERTTNDSGLIKDYDSSKLRNLLTKKRGCKIPFLTQVLERFKSKIGFMIELKEAELWENVVNMIAKEDLLHQIIFSGKDLSLLKIIKNKVPQAKFCYNITRGISISILDFIDSKKLDEFDLIPEMISLRSDLISKSFIEKCHKYKILALSWDFINYKDPVEKIKYLINLGIDGILFDDYHNIDVIKKYLYNL